MTTADHTHPQLEQALVQLISITDRQQTMLERHEAMLERLTTATEATHALLRDEVVPTLTAMNDRLTAIEAHLAEPGRNGGQP